jgi:hypothetical protein
MTAVEQVRSLVKDGMQVPFAIYKTAKDYGMSKRKLSVIYRQGSGQAGDRHAVRTPFLRPAPAGAWWEN